MGLCREEEVPSTKLCTSTEDDCGVLRFHHDPYSATGMFVTEWAPTCGMLHPSLYGRVSFHPFPSRSFECPAEPDARPKADLLRIFIGQLPYDVSDMELRWLCWTFAGAHVHNPERILKHDWKTGKRLPTGCVHVYCTPESARRLMSFMHKRVLVDDNGVWFARDESEMLMMRDYCGALKQERYSRPNHRPYGSIVVQEALSTFVPRNPCF